MIKTIQLFPGVTLRCYRDLRFKQGALSIQFLRQMDREEAALNALLPAVLLRGTERCPDLRSITRRLDDLYGASVSDMVRRIGDYQATGLFCGFMEDRFALEGDKILEPMTVFAAELLFRPLTEDGAFPRDFVESEKVNLIATVESELNDKRAYASAQMLKLMCKTDSYGIPRLGTVEQIRAITSQTLYDHYRKVLAESPVELFYVGSADAEQVARLIRTHFPLGEGTRQAMPAQTAFQDGGGGEKTEELEVSQGKLCMGFSTPITNRTPEFAAMQVFNSLFGAGMTSKLFVNIREKMSLCYAIGSGYYSSKGIMTVSAGIDSDKSELVIGEIMKQLEACCRGEITQLELSAAKEGILSGLRGVHDSPGAIESYYATAALSGLKMTPQAYMAAVEAVDTDQVIGAARSVKRHTTYFLKGVQA